MATLGFSIGKASPVLFCHPLKKFEISCARRRFRCVRRTSGSGLDEKRVGRNWKSNTTILGDEPGMSKEVKILNRKLCWHDGVGISYEADRKHAEAIIRETGASNLTSLKIPMSKKNKGGSARQNRRHCGEEKIGKVAHEGTITDRTDFEPSWDHSV